MASPFPGVDPYVEGPDWEDFHHTLISALKAEIVPLVRPKYVVRAELRVYQQQLLDDDLAITRPDVGIYSQSPSAELPQTDSVTADRTLTALLPAPEELREAFLTLRRRDDDQLVTVIEVLSPSNKRSGNGRADYLQKRTRNLQSEAHVVEIDLLRGGTRLPMASPLPANGYLVYVSRAPARPQCDVYHWTLRQPLPTISIPLADNDPDIRVNLGAIFARAYDESGYDYSLDYTRLLQPPLAPEDEAWVREQLQLRGS